MPQIRPHHRCHRGALGWAHPTASSQRSEAACLVLAGGFLRSGTSAIPPHLWARSPARCREELGRAALVVCSADRGEHDVGDAGVADSVELLGERGLVADQQYVGRAGDAFAVEHRAVLRDLAGEGELLGESRPYGVLGGRETHSKPRHDQRGTDAGRSGDRRYDVVAEQGAEASLEEIARRAGVGSATLHRHFGGRIALLEAVFRSSIDAVCAQATELLDASDPLQALTTWLHAMVAHATGSRGLATALVMSGDRDSDAHARLLTAGRTLVRRAQTEGAVPPDVRIEDLLKLANGISLASGEDTAQADRLLTLAIRGIAPARG